MGVCVCGSEKCQSSPHHNEEGRSGLARAILTVFASPSKISQRATTDSVPAGLPGGHFGFNIFFKFNLIFQEEILL